jgi:hypothetical protein|tara:strand:+ start:42 stop:236 length:195 start_codon:yes stop_codon:yes gene_type:complete
MHYDFQSMAGIPETLGGMTPPGAPVPGGGCGCAHPATVETLWGIDLKLVMWVGLGVALGMWLKK